MSSKDFDEFDPLESLLDNQSDDEFGPAEIREHLGEDLQPLVLRDWSAQDFANIYVRFHPHVLRQAKRYITNHSQAEEVTQDAFLYLMTSLPEVDSEVGVLKLLKWKVRFLALDLIKFNSQASFAPIDDQPELSIDDSALSRELERADDAAIVALALAKLEPRQREALVASLYEEKSSSQVAAQLGLNENATRQLLFRAKAAFKKALVGEAETKGLTVSQIISVAARKASKEAGKYISVASGFVLVLAISIGVLPNLGTAPAQLTADAPVTATSPEALNEATSPPATGANPVEETYIEPSDNLASEQEQTLADGSSEVTDAMTTQLASGTNPQPAQADSEIVGGQSTAANESSGLSNDLIDSSPFDPWLLDPIIDQGRIETSLLSGNANANPVSASLISIVSDRGIWADINFRPYSANPFTAATVGIYVDGDYFFASVKQKDLLVLAEDQNTETYLLVGSIGMLSDVFGNRFRDTRLDGATVEISVSVDRSTGNVFGTSISLAGKQRTL